MALLLTLEVVQLTCDKVDFKIGKEQIVHWCNVRIIFWPWHTVNFVFAQAP